MYVFYKPQTLLNFSGIWIGNRDTGGYIKSSVPLSRKEDLCAMYGSKSVEWHLRQLAHIGKDEGLQVDSLVCFPRWRVNHLPYAVGRRFYIFTYICRPHTCRVLWQGTKNRVWKCAVFKVAVQFKVPNTCITSYSISIRPILFTYSFILNGQSIKVGALQLFESIPLSDSHPSRTHAVIGNNGLQSVSRENGEITSAQYYARYLCRCASWRKRIFMRKGGRAKKHICKDPVAPLANGRITTESATNG